MDCFAQVVEGFRFDSDETWAIAIGLDSTLGYPALNRFDADFFLFSCFLLSEFQNGSPKGSFLPFGPDQSFSPL